MPLKLNLGLTKKVGQPNYGSLGASCHVEVELDAGLLQDDLERFHRHVRYAYAACRQAVEEELTQRQNLEMEEDARSDRPFPPTPSGATAGNGHGKNGHSNHGRATKVPAPCHQPASPRQLDYARQLAEQVIGLGIRRLDPLSQEMFGVPLAGTSNVQASSLIDTLKAMKAGEFAREDAGKGASA